MELCEKYLASVGVGRIELQSRVCVHRQSTPLKRNDGDVEKKKKNKIKRTTNRENNVVDKDQHQEDMWMFLSLVFISHPSSYSSTHDLHFISTMPDVVTFFSSHSFFFSS